MTTHLSCCGTKRACRLTNKQSHCALPSERKCVLTCVTMPFRKAEAITRRIRECCDHLDALEDVLRQDVGVTAAMRAVLEALHERGAQTVPQIARSKKVTRQHIQALADKL